jgi:adenine deaminase
MLLTIPAITESGQIHVIYCVRMIHILVLSFRSHVNRALRRLWAGYTTHDCNQMATINTAEHFGVSRNWDRSPGSRQIFYSSKI